MIGEGMIPTRTLSKRPKEMVEAIQRFPKIFSLSKKIRFRFCASRKSLL